MESSPQPALDPEPLGLLEEDVADRLQVQRRMAGHPRGHLLRETRVAHPAGEVLRPVGKLEPELHEDGPFDLL